MHSVGPYVFTTFQLAVAVLVPIRVRRRDQVGDIPDGLSEMERRDHGGKSTA